MRIISCIYEDNEISYMIANKTNEGKIELLGKMQILKFEADIRQESIDKCTELMKENVCSEMVYEDCFGIMYLGNEEI